jgi:DNA-binding LacI/PurR family transcriptional regulator
VSRKPSVPPDGPAPRVSMKEIARMTGFSPTTVSLVLNGRSRRFNISRETQELIRSVAKAHHYYPNLHARGLRSRTTNIVGLTVPNLDNPFFGEMAETFESLARSNKKLPLITVTHYDPREELETINYFLSQKVECVFTANLTALDEISALCTQAGIQQIVLDSQASAKPTVTTDNVEAAAVLTRNLLASTGAAGREGPVYFVGGMATHAITMQRLAGFKAALKERGAPFGEAQFLQTAFDPEAACRELGALLRSTSEVGGLFLNAVPALVGLVRLYPEVADRCRQIPCAVFDYHPFMSLLADLRLLIIRQNPRQMMNRAYQIFTSPRPPGAKVYYIPHELLLPPGAVAASSRRSGGAR